MTAALLATATAACDNGEDAASTTVAVTTVPATVASVTTTTEVSTTAVATTAVATTAPAQSTAPSTVQVETTTPTTPQPDIEAVREAVIAAAIEAKEAFWAARQEPTPDALERLRAALDGEAESSQLVRVSEGIALGERTQPHPEVPSTYHVDIDSIVLNLADGTATLNSCEINSWIVVLDAADGSAPIVIDDLIYQYKASEDFALVDDSWVNVGGALLSAMVWDGTPCAD